MTTPAAESLITVVTMAAVVVSGISITTWGLGAVQAALWLVVATFHQAVAVMAANVIAIAVSLVLVTVVAVRRGAGTAARRHAVQ